jgi:hypothetical protein
MSKASRLDQVEQECKERGVRLIYDDLRSEGGLCRLRDGYYLILNRRLASENRTRIIVDALVRMRDMIETRPAVSDLVPGAPEVGVSTPLTDVIETAPSVVDYPESVYEESGVGVPVAAGAADSQS